MNCFLADGCRWESGRPSIHLQDTTTSPLPVVIVLTIGTMANSRATAQMPRVVRWYSLHSQTQL